MRKLILILFGLLLAVAVSSQGTRVYNQDIRINKTTPILDLQGLGAKIYMDGATSGTATLQPYAVAAGILVLPSSAGTDTLATKAYARSVGGGIGGGISPSDTSIMLAPYTKHYSDTMSVSAGVLRTKVTTLTTEPYSVQIFSSGGKDITNAVSDSIGLSGGFYNLYVYSVDALSGAKIKILY